MTFSSRPGNDERAAARHRRNRPAMIFLQPLQEATLVRRYKRFLADVLLPDGQTLTVHCPNSGSMLGCDAPGSEVRISTAANPRRKYGHTLEMVRVGKTWVGINTALTNGLVRDALAAGLITEVGLPESIRAEVKTSDHTRLDLLVQTGGGQVFIEVKNCSLAEQGVAMFPDAVTKRGTKHLLELLRLKQSGDDAVVLFCVQRGDAAVFSPARDIDPVYAETLAMVHGQGVLVLAYQAEVSPEGIEVVRPLPVRLGGPDGPS